VALTKWIEVRCPKCHRLMFRTEGKIEVEMVCFKCKAMWLIRVHDGPGQGGPDFKLLKEGKGMSRGRPGNPHG
jgi:phage FluMu protein Com